MTNADKFDEVFGKSIEFLLFKVSYSYLVWWANQKYEEPKGEDDG